MVLNRPTFGQLFYLLEMLVYLCYGQIASSLEPGNEVFASLQLGGFAGLLQLLAKICHLGGAYGGTGPFEAMGLVFYILKTDGLSAFFECGDIARSTIGKHFQELARIGGIEA